MGNHQNPAASVQRTAWSCSRACTVAIGGKVDGIVRLANRSRASWLSA